jgi:hypothetical protein
MPRYKLIVEFDAEHDESAVEAVRLARRTFDFQQHGYALVREMVRPWQSVAVLANKLPPARKPPKVRT